MKPTILFEDENIIAINKPAGLVVHAGVNVTEETLADWIEENFKALKEVGEVYRDELGNEFPRPGIVHRLDKDTSGVMILAKTQNSFEEIKKRFQKHQVKKEYHAFVHGAFTKERGMVSLPITRSRRDFRKQTTGSGRGEPRNAETDYIVMSKCGEKSSFVRFFPKTGRTHQIRVHAQSIDHPVVGDSTYAPKKRHILGFKRLALHSYRLEFPFHTKENPYSFIAPHPQDFLEAMESCDAQICKELVSRGILAQ